MRSLRPLLALLLAVALAAVSPTAASADPGVRYVALGDSYSAGLGTSGSYTDAACDRTDAAFPALWSATHAPASFVSVACAGATTDSVISAQVPSLSRDTSLVSLTAGGNDIGFSAIMTSCALHRNADCIAAVDQAEHLIATTLPGRLDAVYSAIAAAAPYAEVVVLGYPQFYQLHRWFCLGVAENSRDKIDEGINALDDAIAAAAGRHGFTFTDVRSAFVGHQLCSGSKWLHAADLAALEKSYHPTATGQREGYLPAFTTAAG